MKRALLVLAACCVAGTALVAHGQREGENDQPVVLPSFSFDIVVGPATGAIHIPPADPPSKPYQAFVTVQESWVYEGRLKSSTGRRFISSAVYAGGKEAVSGSLGSFEMNMTVEIDSEGERAEVAVDVVREEDDLVVASHRFVAHLPASQLGR